MVKAVRKALMGPLTPNTPAMAIDWISPATRLRNVTTTINNAAEASPWTARPAGVLSPPLGSGRGPSSKPSVSLIVCL